MSDDRERITIVGPGAVGTSLGIRLRACGLTVDRVVGRSRSSAERGAAAIGQGEAIEATPGRSALASPPPRWILLSTPDDAIAAAAAQLAADAPDLDGTVAFHVSGALASDVLAPLRSRGATIASLHPLRSFASSAEAAAAFEGTLCFCEGDGDDLVVDLVGRIGGIAVRLPTESKELYHAAASMTSNAMVALLWVARRCMIEAGVERAIAGRAVAELALGTARNVRDLGLPDALTGPIERGDVHVVEGHLAALAARAPDAREVYLPLARATVEAAMAKGSLDEASAAALRRVLAEGRS